MSEEWYSRKPQTRFSREHRDLLPAGARMIDIDGCLYAPYVKGAVGGGPLMLIEFKPEGAREDFWLVTRQLARRAGLPSARVIEQANGRYTIALADGDGYGVRNLGTDLTIQDWYEDVEVLLREAAGHLVAA